MASKMVCLSPSVMGDTTDASIAPKEPCKRRGSDGIHLHRSFVPDRPLGREQQVDVRHDRSEGAAICLHHLFRPPSCHVKHTGILPILSNTLLRRKHKGHEGDQ